MKNKIAVIEIGSNNTKTHVYEENKMIYEKTTTIEFKKNYKLENKINKEDLEKLYDVIKDAMNFTTNIHIYGCSIFRNITEQELTSINERLRKDFSVSIEVVSQEKEAEYTALGCYSDVDYDGNMCIFIGGGGSIELILVNNKKVIDKKYYEFGVVDVTNKFESLKEDIPTCTFDDVYNYIDALMKNIDFKADVLILAGGDHLYWYNNAQYKLIKNNIYTVSKQPYMLTRIMSDKYDKNALVTSLNAIKNRSDNPLWFNGSRAMKVITNYISHKIDAKYIIPTKINMEDGIISELINDK